eukprot:GGOE01022089.1.p1 GENE.GGOE01022089.1~~GGOE01022089.1.p1  ORF type:complete len:486 (-),score=104.03 GGOE01022089.1:136-1593(-)
MVHGNDENLNGYMEEEEEEVSEEQTNEEEDWQFDPTQISILLEGDGDLAVNNPEVLEAIRQYERECGSWREVKPSIAHPVFISSGLILDRCINKHEVDMDNEEALTDSILHITHLTLDECNLRSLDNLDCYTDVTHAYFQHNFIEKIGDAFEFHNKLKVLVLSHNKIATIGGVAHLPNLQLLDMSYNKIQDVPSSSLPTSLQHFNVTGNPLGIPEEELCLQLAVHLPHLLQLNEIRIDNVMRIKCGAPLNDNTAADANGRYGLKVHQQREEEEATFLTTLQGSGAEVQLAQEGMDDEASEVEDAPLSTSIVKSGGVELHSHAGLAIAQALRDLQARRDSDRTFYNRISEGNGQLDAEAEQWLQHRRLSRDSLTMFAKPQAIPLRPSSARSMTSLSNSVNTTRLAESQSDIPTLHAELMRLAGHKGNFGCEQLNEDFDDALLAMRERKDAIVGRSRQRRLQLDEAYAQRKDSFKKGNWSGAQPTNK